MRRLVACVKPPCRRPSVRWPAWALLIAAAVVLLAAGATADDSLAFKDAKHPGIVLFAYGRCSTGSTWETIRTVMRRSGFKMEPLCGQKEGFKNQNRPSRENVDRCHRQLSPGAAFFTHVKPWHIVSKSDLPNVEAMLAHMKKRGARVLGVQRRNNWFARDISSYELTHSKPTHILHQNYSKNIEEFEDGLAAGIAAGQKLGFVVVNITFTPEDWPCSGVDKLLDAAASAGVIPTEGRAACIPSSSHTGSSHHSKPVEKRFPPKLLRKVRHDLKGTSYEWMLDVSRETPPNQGDQHRNRGKNHGQ